MLFCEQLNAFMEEIACTANELCEKAELSAASVSRYRSGERIPEQGGQTFARLCSALERLFRKESCGGVLRLRKLFRYQL